ncbi:hypothetical protein HK097_008326, partial [Rhizophlyctis rosea]
MSNLPKPLAESLSQTSPIHLPSDPKVHQPAPHPLESIPHDTIKTHMPPSNDSWSSSGSGARSSNKGPDQHQHIPLASDQKVKDAQKLKDQWGEERGIVHEDANVH